MDIGLLATIPTFMFAIAMIGYMFFCARADSGKGSSEAPDRNEMKKYLIWGLFYSNPEDPRGWVPKVRGYGWTVNFRKRHQVYIFSGLIFLTLISGIVQTLVCTALL